VKQVLANVLNTFTDSLLALHKTISGLLDENTELKRENAQLKNDNSVLKEQISFMARYN
jgi:regulator of replication initiation timing